MARRKLMAIAMPLTNLFYKKEIKMINKEIKLLKDKK